MWISKTAKTTFHSLNGRPLLGAAVAAIVLDVVGRMIGGAQFKNEIALDVFRTLVFATLVYGSLACCCWPLTKYSIVIIATLVFRLSLLLISNAIVLVTVEDLAYQYEPWQETIRRELQFFVTDCAVFATPLLVAVFARRRFWPVYLPGHCRNCGYNLFGLSSNRCPECGEPFTPENNAPLQNSGDTT